MWLVVLAVTGPAVANAAQTADEPAWYVGVGAGKGEAKRTNSWANQTDAALAVRGITSSTLIDGHHTAWKFFGGYRFNDLIALEAGYQDLGSYSGNTTVTVPAPRSTVGATWDASAFSLAAVASYPLTERFGILFKGGLAATRLKVEVPSPAQFSANETRVQPLLGIGVKFNINREIGVRTEFERFNNVGNGSTTGQSNINVWSISGLYRF